MNQESRWEAGIDGRIESRGITGSGCRHSRKTGMFSREKQLRTPGLCSPEVFQGNSPPEVLEFSCFPWELGKGWEFFLPALQTEQLPAEPSRNNRSEAPEREGAGMTPLE